MTKVSLPPLRMSVTYDRQKGSGKYHGKEPQTSVYAKSKRSLDQERRATEDNEDTVFLIPNDSEMVDSGIKLKNQISVLSQEECPAEKVSMKSA